MGTTTGDIKFGRAFGEKHFMFKPGYITGSYGAYPRQVRDALRSVQDEIQAAPDGFVRFVYPERLKVVRHLLADFLRADVDEVVIVPNATIGLNAVLRNLVFKPGDRVAYVKGIYGAIEKTVDYLAETTPVASVCIEFDLIADDDEKLLRCFRSTLDRYKNQVKVAIFDTVMSMPGLRMPFERLAQTCKDYGVLSVIDAAHGIGLIDLDLRSLEADFLVTNCHKWLFVPHTCAVLYVARRNQHLMRSSIPTSHGFQPLPDIVREKQYISAYEASESTNPFVYQFEYTGTIDNGPPLCVPSALEFRKTVCGGERHVRDYCQLLARDGEALAVKLFGTEALRISESKRVAFANVRLPLQFSSKVDDGTLSCIPIADAGLVLNLLLRRLRDDYDTFVNIAFVSGSLWARFSAMIYLELEDFEYGATALKALCTRVSEGDYRVSHDEAA
ncbi:hypothetical protein LTR10_018297 [Elasticomyces elasticus]|uniref:Aminotransferase class V domain-containing protein n=1 Tax=Exophiala sideris TaxID=1016849 RepID=A0ABR0JM92_9EURO|nr:hypothetical protein LTR10_018297 [Elasticomyces elasticus]KAK5036687.1 hypothetical protein LTS07_002415 [Exophiala sideris]KAK5041486.1 hypothetical protein LTR13_002151 [Exophiala sideris]KAK5067071.1 hypothetical protein LTR69_002420 [Exophiala sideris]KAK5185129.1 hypothetical protein LTR44_002976 [Eurotiomycetes sp. CCFEE 6388]